jgi:hypothetical protein
VPDRAPAPAPREAPPPNKSGDKPGKPGKKAADKPAKKPAAKPTKKPVEAAAGKKPTEPRPPAKPGAKPPREPEPPVVDAPDPEDRPARGGGFDAVAVKPGPETQTQKSAKDRGINPCLTPDPGFGSYRFWDRGVTVGQFIQPGRGGLTKSGQFDVMVHFHGHEAVRKEWVQVMDGAVLVGIDLGIGSGAYSGTFSNPHAFEALIHSVETTVAKKAGVKSARVRHVGLSAWSAGYGAVGEILSQDYGKRVVDTVILLDGLHSGYEGRSLNAAQLKPFVDYAQRAADKRVMMFVSHSSIVPPGYASTTETAHYLVHRLGGRVRKQRGRGPMGLEMIDRWSRGYFHMRGYVGNDKMDHCAHIGLLRDVLRTHVKKRWKSPKGRAPAIPVMTPRREAQAAAQHHAAAAAPPVGPAPGEAPIPVE